MMSINWSMDGKVYHDLKIQFKKIRDELGGRDLKYMGFHEMAWRSSKEYIKLNADRDVDDNGNEYTKTVDLIWEGDEKTPLLNAMCKLFDSVAERTELGAMDADFKLNLFDGTTQQTIENMKNDGAPEGYINSWMKDRDKARKALVGEPEEENRDAIKEAFMEEPNVIKFLKDSKSAYSIVELSDELGLSNDEVIKQLDSDSVVSKIAEGITYYGVM